VSPLVARLVLAPAVGLGDGPMAALTLETKLEEIARSDRRYAVEAYQFVFEALDYVLAHPGCRKSAAGRHVTVSDLLEGMRRFGLEHYGPLARCVFESWGVYSTEDFGEIVFRLIDQRLLHQGEHDRREDFAGAFDFVEAFETGYRVALDLGPSR